MTYEEALAAIAALEPRGWKLGLERMTEFIHRLGLDEAMKSRRYVHIAGTNGKGSTTSYAQSILIAAGHQTGGFFSPFVIDPRERVQMNGELIPKATLASLAEELLEASKQFDETEYGGISEFELKTALGFLYWEREGAKWVALETGLGGRLDSTNVVTPAVSIIVSIGLDHQAILGDTVELIAFEKAGIIKPGRPVVIGKMPEAAREVILGVARERNSPVWLFGEDIQLDGDAVVTPAGRVDQLKPAMVGVWQRHNLALAIAGLQMAGAEVSDEAIRLGARAAKLPGRFQRLTHGGVGYILDGAHNEDSAQGLAQTLQQELGDRKLTLVTNMLSGHDPSAFYGYLAPHVGRVIVVPIGFHRARPVAETVALLKELGFQAETADTAQEGLNQAESYGEEILVTGSFYLVGEIGGLLGLGT